jgi:hypothetical protein
MQAQAEVPGVEDELEIGPDEQGVYDFEVVTPSMEVDDDDEDEELTFTDDE